MPVTMTKVLLLKSWDHEGTEFRKGQILECDAATAEDLVDKGIAELYSDGDDGDSDDDDAGEDEGKKSSSKTVTMTESELEEFVERQIDKARKAGEKSAKERKRPLVRVGEDQIVKDTKWGFSRYGEFAQCVMQASIRGGTVDPRFDRLVKQMGDERRGTKGAATTFGSTFVGADGAFAIPPDFSNMIMGYAFPTGTLMNMIQSIPLQGNSFAWPTDETTPWSSDGITAAWKEEGTAASQTKPKLKENMLRLKELIVLVPMTNEILEDAGALEGYLGRKAGDKIRFKVDDAIVNGNGATQPLGMLNSGALVSFSRAASGNNIDPADVAAMVARMIFLGNGVWAINHDALPDLLVMTIGNQPAFQPPMGPAFAVAPNGTLFGRPIAITQACQSLGTKGDIILFDPTQYLMIGKEGGIQAAVSIHLFFDANTTAFRYVLRVNGQPWPSATVTPAHGSNALGYFVALDDA